VDEFRLYTEFIAHPVVNLDHVFIVHPVASVMSVYCTGGLS